MFISMSDESIHKFIAILNPAARVGRLAGDVESIRQAFSESGLDIQVALTERPLHAMEIARNATDTGRAVLAVGGDGTVNEVARGLMDGNTSQTMAVLPLGTGNDFARMIGMASSLKDAIAQLKTGVVRSVDVGRVTFVEGETSTSTFFVNAAGIGFDGYVATIAPRYKGWPFNMGYLISILVSLATWKSGRVVVRDLSDPGIHVFDQNMFFMTVGNARDSGGGYSINPRASIVDGKLDVCLVAAVSRLRALRMLPAARDGNHLSLNEVRYWHSERIQFSTDTPMPLHTDGEVQSYAVDRLEISVIPGALRVLVPHHAAGNL